MSTRKQHICRECGRMKDRCKAASVDQGGDIIWVCRDCWHKKDYDAFMYEHRQKELNV